MRIYKNREGTMDHLNKGTVGGAIVQKHIANVEELHG